LAPLHAALESEIQESQRLRARRAEQAPLPTFPEDLPITAYKDQIARAIREHQVVVISGETGSGKSTQLPKICLELGRGIDAMIGHTQPRRLAARTLSARIASELGTRVGDAVGYKVRFDDRTSDRTYVALMTDGILLAETTGDRFLERYDTIIIDEAHERTLNVDFLLGYLKQLVPKRPDLKVIITSATLDPERFSRHFTDAPIIAACGRGYPVDIRYRPLRGDGEDEESEDRGMDQAIGDAVQELFAEGPGDILVFLPTERDIRDTAESLADRALSNPEIVPLYA